MTLTITKKINICYDCSWLVTTKVNKRTQFQHNFFVKDICAKTILPIYLVPHLKIFPMKNNNFIWKIKEARNIESLKKFYLNMWTHATRSVTQTCGYTQQGLLLDNFITCFHVGQIVESPFIFHRTQNLNQNDFIKLNVFTQLVYHNGGALDLYPKLGNWIFILSFSHHWINIVNHGQLGKKKRLHIKLLKFCYTKVSYGGQDNGYILVGRTKCYQVAKFCTRVNLTILGLYLKRFLDNQCLALISVDNYLVYRGQG